MNVSKIAFKPLWFISLSPLPPHHRGFLLYLQAFETLTFPANSDTFINFADFTFGHES